MNYYIQGNKEKADQIKAAFENKGMSDLSGYNFGNKHALFYTYDCGGSKVLATVCANLHVADIIKTHPDYKELELSVKPHYDINNFHVGMPVLVRDGWCKKWCYTLYSHYDSEDDYYPFITAGDNAFFQCIPFNDDTKHLLGTTDMPDEMYINW